MVTIDAILALHKAGYSQRKIAELLVVDRETVGKYVAPASPPPLTGSVAAPPGTGAVSLKSGNQFASMCLQAAGD